MEQRSLANADPPGDDQGRPAGILGPHTLGSIISNTFTIYGNNFFKMIALSSVFLAFFVAILIVVVAFVIVYAIGQQNLSMPVYLVFIGLAVLLMLLSVIARVFIDSMAIVYVANYFRGHTSLQQSYRAVLGKFWTIFGAGALSTVALLGMTITIIGMPFAIYFSVCWGFIPHAIIFEDCSAGRSLVRAVELVKQNWWRVWGIMLVMGLILFAMGLGTYFIPLVSSLAGFIIEPLGPMAMTLLYFDLRVRKENYKIPRFNEDLARLIPDQ
jgi:hypothetical protein